MVEVGRNVPITQETNKSYIKRQLFYHRRRNISLTANPTTAVKQQEKITSIGHNIRPIPIPESTGNILTSY